MENSVENLKKLEIELPYSFLRNLHTVLYFFEAGRLIRCESFHPGVTSSIPPASHICPVCSKCSEIWKVGILWELLFVVKLPCLNPLFLSSKHKRLRGDDKSRISFSLFNFYKIFSLARSWTDSSQSIFLAPCPFQTYSEARTNFPDERLTLHSPLEPFSSSCFTAHHSFLIILSPPPFLSLMYFHFVSSPENISQDIICQDGFGLWNKVFQCPTTFPRGWQEFLSSKKMYFSLIC